VERATSKQAHGAPSGSSPSPVRLTRGRDIVVVGASAGGVEALSRLMQLLPEDLPASIFVVLHMAAESTSVLPAILDRAGPLVRGTVEDGSPIEHGRVYVAPPGQHMLLDRGRIRLGRGPREHGHRPAIDPLFRTAAASYGPRTVGVLLSGALDDGVAGLAGLKRRGGIALVQNPTEAMFSGMPEAAIRKVHVDGVLPIVELAPELVRLATSPIPSRPEAHETRDDPEGGAARLERGAGGQETPGLRLTCPECGAALTEHEDADAIVSFTCDVGHTFSEESLIPQQSNALESALWAAVRVLNERTQLLSSVAKRVRAGGDADAADRYEAQARESVARARVVRRAVLASAVEDIEAEVGAPEWPDS
jgi:two-component system, chemotaxis family, protein-glutamate methylesterase/glutaminase